MKTKTLLQIYNECVFNGYRTDKGTTHSYIDQYEQLLAPYRDKSILEIGVLDGSSLLMWKNYFSEVYGIDTNTPSLPLENIKFIQGDSISTKVFNQLANKQFDVIIDDSNHHVHSMICNFQMYKQLLKPDGLYVIEDLQNQESIELLKIVDDFEVVDLRSLKGRYDDVLMVFNNRETTTPTHPKIIVLNAQNEKYRSIYEITKDNKQSYCNRHGYEYRAEWFGDIGRTPHWGRIAAIKKHLSECEWLFYLDTDIVITNPLHTIEQYIDDDYDCIIGRMPTAKHLSTSGILIRNCDWSYRMLDEWDKQRDNCWYSSSDIAQGGGCFYDQSGFHCMYDNNGWVRDRCCVLPIGDKNFNNESFSWRAGDWLLHCPGITTLNKFNELKQMLERL